MSRKIYLTLLFGMAFILLAGNEIKAQETATIQARATVLPALTVFGTNDLLFQSVVPGINKSVDATTIGLAGEWTLIGELGAEITLDFNLPSVLTSNGNNLIIVFSSTDASYSNDPLNTQSNPTALIDPAAVTTSNLGASGNMTVWIGGTVAPTAWQTSGEYSASIELTVTLTGN